MPSDCWQCQQRQLDLQHKATFYTLGISGELCYWSTLAVKHAAACYTVLLTSFSCTSARSSPAIICMPKQVCKCGRRWCLGQQTLMPTQTNCTHHCSPDCLSLIRAGLARFSARLVTRAGSCKYRRCWQIMSCISTGCTRMHESSANLWWYCAWVDLPLPVLCPVS